VAVQRIERSTIRFIDDLAGWDRAVPATLVTPATTPDQRDAILRALVARALTLHPDLVEIERATDHPPAIGKPLGAGLHLSSASRGGLTALAVAPGPVGADVEALDIDAEIPWNVLHPIEVAALRALAGRRRTSAFTRLWSLKECYLKALGVGLRREPASFAITFADGETATVEDPETRIPVADARTTWRAVDGVWLAVSTVVLTSEPPRKDRREYI
jgi:phosphopantetheinyl transferase